MTLLPDRYDRQMILPEIGADGQAKLARIKMLVVGAGGLGAPVLSYLSGAGVGHITIIDHDIVSASNLHRQTLFTQDQIGQSKAGLATRFCRNLNKDIDVIAINQKLTPLNAADLVVAADIVLDALTVLLQVIFCPIFAAIRQRPLSALRRLAWQVMLAGFVIRHPHCALSFRICRKIWQAVQPQVCWALLLACWEACKHK